MLNTSDALLPSDLELQVVHYEPQEHYTLHLDADLGNYALAAGLERFVSMFLYLSDVSLASYSHLPALFRCFVCLLVAFCLHRMPLQQPALARCFMCLLRSERVALFASLDRSCSSQKTILP